MSIRLSEKYPLRSVAPSLSYPGGSILNETTPGARDGTPLDLVWGNDQLGFFSKIIFEAGITPSDIPDTAVESDYFNGLSLLFQRTYNSILVLKAITYTPKDGQVVSILGYSTKTENEDWRFQWSTADLSTEVAADPLNGIYIALNSDPTGASGAFVRLYEGPVHADWFGPSANIIQAALSFSNDVILTEGKVYEPDTIIILIMKTLRTLSEQKDESSTAIIRPTAAVSVGILLDSGAQFRGAFVDGVNTNDAIGVIVSDSVVSNLIYMKQVEIQRFTGVSGKGVSITNSVNSNFYDCRIMANTVGMLIRGQTGSFPTLMSFYNCAFFRNDTVGVKIDRGYEMLFFNCLFEENGEEGLLADSILDLRKLTIQKCFFENNYDGFPAEYQLVIDGSVNAISNVVVADNFFHFDSALAAKFSRVLNISFHDNEITANAGMVRFDTNSTGWIYNQPSGTTAGTIVDDTGFMVERDKDLEAWTTPVFNAADFTTEAGVITVEAGDVSAYDYRIVGKTMYLNINIGTITLSEGTQWIAVKIPAGKISESAFVTTSYMDANGTIQAGYSNAAASGDTVFFRKVAAGDIPASANSTGIAGNFVFEIQ